MFTVLALGFGLGCGRADEPKKDDAAKAATAKLDELKKKMEGEMNALQAEFTKLDKKDEAGKEKIFAKAKTLSAGFAEQALVIAKAAINDDTGLEALQMAIGMGDEKTVTAAGELAAASLTDEKKLNNVIGILGMVDDGAKGLEAIAAKVSKKELKAFALFSGLNAEIKANDKCEPGKTVNVKERVAKADALLVKLDAMIKEYGDVEIPSNRGGNVKISKAADGTKFALQHLGIGRPAPEVECEIVDMKDKDAKNAKNGKLSDFKGKVVVLDIWATWCGPCVGMIPHERELVAARKDKPFAFISVSADDTRKELVEFLEKTEMPWTQWWDGAKKVQEAYKVEFFPTIYVIDANGIIRYKHVRGKEMDEAVDALLKEMGK
jgi:thiol-disulfide isomerase/thioredoxin